MCARPLERGLGDKQIELYAPVIVNAISNVFGQLHRDGVTSQQPVVLNTCKISNKALKGLIECSKECLESTLEILFVCASSFSPLTSIVNLD